MLTYGYFAVLPFIFCIISTHTSVVWKIQTVPIVIGEDVVIQCIVSVDACRIDHTKQWTGGKGYKLIGLNGHTTNKSKYTMNVYKSTLSFELRVKNFTEADANNEYTCLCGKAHYTAMLMLNTTGHVYIPLDDEIIDNSYFKDNTIHVNLTIMKVHPLPTCYLQYNGLTKKLKAHGNENEYSNNTFYEIVYEDTTAVHKRCNITWFFNCTFGKKSFRTDYHNLYSCNLDYVPKDKDVKPIYILFVIPVILLLIVVYIVYLKCRNSERKSNVENEESNSLQQIHT